MGAAYVRRGSADTAAPTRSSAAAAGERRRHPVHRLLAAGQAAVGARSANTSTRPCLVRTSPASAFIPSSRPLLACTTPAPACVVGGVVAGGQRAGPPGDGQPVEDRLQLGVGGVGGQRRSTSTSRPAAPGRPWTGRSCRASARRRPAPRESELPEPVDDGGRGPGEVGRAGRCVDREDPAERLGQVVVALRTSMCSTSAASGGLETVPTSRAPGGTRPRPTASTADTPAAVRALPHRVGRGQRWASARAALGTVSADTGATCEPR